MCGITSCTCTLLEAACKMAAAAAEAVAATGMAAGEDKFEAKLSVAHGCCFLVFVFGVRV